MSEVATLNRTLDQELVALVRGVSLECPLCGEFVLHVRDVIGCPQCGSSLAHGHEVRDVQRDFASRTG